MMTDSLKWLWFNPLQESSESYLDYKNHLLEILGQTRQTCQICLFQTHTRTQPHLTGPHEVVNRLIPNCKCFPTSKFMQPWTFHLFAFAELKSRNLQLCESYHHCLFLFSFLPFFGWVFNIHSLMTSGLISALLHSLNICTKIMRVIY